MLPRHCSRLEKTGPGTPSDSVVVVGIALGNDEGRAPAGPAFVASHAMRLNALST